MRSSRSSRSARAVAVVVLLVPVLAAAQPARPRPAPPPIIDVHMHALPVGFFGRLPARICAPAVDFPPRDPKRPGTIAPCPKPLLSPTTDEELLRRTLEVMERRNIIGVVSGPLEVVQRWRRAAPARVIPGIVTDLPVMRAGESPDSVRRLIQSGEISVLGEVTAQYLGVSPSDSTFEPYLKVAEELDAPVGIHMGLGPYAAPYAGYPQYRAALSDPLLLEDALLRHPKLRVYVMHAGWPLLDRMIALLYSHPQVYVDVGVISFWVPRKEFHHYLRRLVEAGFGTRIMFGSDQMVWPEAIEVGIEAIETAAFLTPAQKRDILYNNAARFLRLDQSKPPAP